MRTNGPFAPVNAGFPTSGRFYPTGDIKYRLRLPYYGFTETQVVVRIMSIEKNTPGEESATSIGSETGIEPNDASQAGRGQGIEILALNTSDEFDAGSDPYNRTGSFCIVKNRDKD